ncbi:Nuclear transport receptor CRM1/MSN5 (importin beta superfamily) [Trachipleistophora hominis]|uniref:Nuclear transport receptor CRM1/MSN5 (Importin beta superfamily) n=1 Tax=Trachipleistophora hominis TaxID=72359 RepID=L7JW29_TRAHO|nr:Nuclear transport receptor CRM1/MSN5 (importin beta superfamily) [Trachipleistophora hominis]
MPRPIEVLIVENEDGEIVREKVEGTENLEFGRMMAYKAWQFAHTSPAYAKSHLLQILEGLFSTEDEMNTGTLNTMCWTVGCIQGALSAEDEDPFYVDVLKDLLTLCENRHRKEDKAIIASNIMYVVGKYYQFLRRNTNFLRTVAKKLFEFMREEYEGIKDMACDTLLMICEKVTMHDLQREFVAHVIDNVNEITALLHNYQKRVVYTSLLIVIRGSNDLIERLCAVLTCTSASTRDTCHYVKSHALVLKYYVSAAHAQRILALFNSADLYVKYDVLEYFAEYFRYVAVDERAFEMVRFFVELGPFDHRNLGVLSAFSARINAYEEDEDVSDDFDFNGESRSGRDRESRESSKGRESRSIGESSKGRDIDSTIRGGTIRSGNIRSAAVKGRDDYPINTNSPTNTNPFINSPTNKTIPPLVNAYFTAIVNSVLLPAMPRIKHSDEFSYAYYDLILHSINITFINKILLNDEFIETVYAGLCCQYNTASKCIKILRALYKTSEQHELVLFAERNALRTVENLIGVVLDRDKEYIFCECVLLLQHVLRSSDARDMLVELLCALQNVSREYVMLFVEGMVAIRDRRALFGHAKDFKVRVLEYFDECEYNDELELLKERIKL